VQNGQSALCGGSGSRFITSLVKSDGLLPRAGAITTHSLVALFCLNSGIDPLPVQNCDLADTIGYFGHWGNFYNKIITADALCSTEHLVIKCMIFEFSEEAAQE
jgi:hypothetical protein